jgi:hypothetical protein
MSFYTSNEWYEMRNGAIEHFGECNKCGSRDRLTVHHRHYRTFGGNEKLDDLEVLCFDCHKGIHNIEEEYWKSIIHQIERLEADIRNPWRGRSVELLKKDLKSQYDELEHIKARQGREFIIIHDCFLCPYSKEGKKYISKFKCTKYGKFGCYPGGVSSWDD